MQLQTPTYTYMHTYISIQDESKSVLNLEPELEPFLPGDGGFPILNLGFIKAVFIEKFIYHLYHNSICNRL